MNIHSNYLLSATFQQTCTDVSSVNVGSFYTISSHYFAGGTFISDGGDDMYDNGNCISVPATPTETTHCSAISSSMKVTYKANCETGTVNGESYSMSMMNGGISLLRFQRYTKDTISINGNIGADGTGFIAGGSYTTGDWSGFWKVTWGGTTVTPDPGINHLWVTNAPSAIHTYPSSTNWDYDQLSNVNGYEVVYLMWGTVAGTRTSDAAMEELVQLFVSKCYFAKLYQMSFFVYNRIF